MSNKITKSTKNVLITITALTLVIVLMTSYFCFNITNPFSRFIEKQTTLNRGYYGFYSSAYRQTEEMLEQDLEAVRLATETRTADDVALFKETDLDIIAPFKRLLPEESTSSKVSMYLTVYNPLLHLTTGILKLYYNRARPYQLADIQILENKTAKTPSYPSGHALQAFALSKRLTKKYPEKAVEIQELAEQIADVRKIGGVHYPSDKEYSRYLATRLPWI